MFFRMQDHEDDDDDAVDCLGIPEECLSMVDTHAARPVEFPEVRVTEAFMRSALLAWSPEVGSIFLRRFRGFPKRPLDLAKYTGSEKEDVINLINDMIWELEITIRDLAKSCPQKAFFKSDLHSHIKHCLALNMFCLTVYRANEDEMTNSGLNDAWLDLSSEINQLMAKIKRAFASPLKRRQLYSCQETAYIPVYVFFDDPEDVKELAYTPRELGGEVAQTA